MPGKVNPVIPEMVNQVAFWVIGNDVTVTMAAEGGQLQLNAFEPIICHGLLQSIAWMARAFDSLRSALRRRHPRRRGPARRAAARNVGLVTALPPQLGYARAAEIAKAVLAGEGDVRALALATGSLDSDALDALLRPETLANLVPVLAQAGDPWVVDEELRTGVNHPSTSRGDHVHD